MIYLTSAVDSITSILHITSTRNLTHYEQFQHILIARQLCRSDQNYRTKKLISGAEGLRNAPKLEEGGRSQKI